MSKREKESQSTYYGAERLAKTIKRAENVGINLSDFIQRMVDQNTIAEERAKH